MSKELLTRKFSILCRYLPYGVQVLYKNEIYDLIGLTNLGQKSANILKPFASDVGQWVPILEVIPILRPFKRLSEVITWKNKAVVPAIQLARIALNDENFSRTYDITDEDDRYITVKTEKEGEDEPVFVDILPGDFDCYSETVDEEGDSTPFSTWNVNKYIHTLYSMGFAVSMKEDEFIERKD